MSSDQSEQCSTCSLSVDHHVIIIIMTSKVAIVTLVNVVEPEAIRICLTLLWKRCWDSSSTFRKHWAVLSFVTSFCKFHTPSWWAISSYVTLHLGSIRHSKPDMLKSRLGLSLLYTDTKLSGLSQSIVVIDLGNLFLMSQNTARPLLQCGLMTCYCNDNNTHMLPTNWLISWNCQRSVLFM